MKRKYLSLWVLFGSFLLGLTPIEPLGADPKGDDVGINWSGLIVKRPTNAKNNQFYEELSIREYLRQLRKVGLVGNLGCQDLALIMPTLLTDPPLSALLEHVAIMQKHIDQMAKLQKHPAHHEEEIAQLKAKVELFLKGHAGFHNRDLTYLVAGANTGREIDWILDYINPEASIIAIERAKKPFSFLEARFHGKKNIQLRNADLLTYKMSPKKRVKRMLLMFSALLEFIGEEKLQLLKQAKSFLEPGGILVTEVNLTPFNKMQSHLELEEPLANMLQVKLENATNTLERITTSEIIDLAEKAGFAPGAFVIKYHTTGSPDRAIIELMTPY